MGLKINLEFDGAAQAAPATFRAAIQHAASILDAAFSNPVTINIQVQYGENGIPSGYGLGGPTSGAYAGYSTVRADLIANASGGSYFAALPAGSAIQGQSSIAVGPAE
jgi:serralysin